MKQSYTIYSILEHLDAHFAHTGITQTKLRSEDEYFILLVMLMNVVKPLQRFDKILFIETQACPNTCICLLHNQISHRCCTMFCKKLSEKHGDKY